MKMLIVGERRYSAAVVNLCLVHECGGDAAKLPAMLRAYYHAYAWSL